MKTRNQFKNVQATFFVDNNGIAKPYFKDVFIKRVNEEWASMVIFSKKHWFKLSICAVLAIGLFIKGISINIGSAGNSHTQQSSFGSIQSSKDEKPAIDNIGFSKLNKSEIHAYISRFSEVAKKEETKFGIPSAIILSNAILLSNAGTNRLSIEANNHFGVLCKDDLMPEGIKGKVNLNKQCYLVFDNAWTSFRAFSMLFSKGKMLELKNFCGKDIVKWAEQLQKAGIVRDSEYAKQILFIIREYNL